MAEQLWGGSVSNKGINEVHLKGHLGRDAEVRYTSGGKAVASLSVATSYKNKTEWHKVVAWENFAEAVKDLRKGAEIELWGSLQTRKWQDKDGKDRYTTEINVYRLGGGDGNSNVGRRERASSGDDADSPF